MTTTLATRTAKNVTAKKAEWLEERQTYLGATDMTPTNKELSNG